MENATDGLKIAFAVLVFVLALTVAINLFTQLNHVSKTVLSLSDITKFYEYTVSEDTTRVVGLETIIPTLYKYYKENYTVLFLDRDARPLPLYTSQTNRELWGSGIDEQTGKNPNAGNIAKYYTTNKALYSSYDEKKVCTFDVDDETIRHEPWTGANVDFKKNLDAFLYGNSPFYYPSDNGQKYDYTQREHLNNSQGFIGKYNNTQFKEMLGEYTYNLTEKEDNALLKNRKKRVIIYQII